MVAGAPKFLEEGDAKLNSDSLNYMKSEHAADIKRDGVDILVDHYRAELTGKHNAEWDAMKTNVNDFTESLVRDLIEYAGSLPLQDLKDENLHELIQSKMSSFKKPLDPSVKDHLNNHGVVLLRGAIGIVSEKDLKSKDGSLAGEKQKIILKNLKNEIEGRLRSSLASGIATAYDNQSKAKVDQSLDILRSNLLETPKLSDAHIEKIATSIANRLIDDAGIANNSGKYPNTLLRVIVAKDVTNRADAVLQKVDQAMATKSQHQANVSEVQSEQSPELPPMRNESTVKLSRKENEGLTVTLKGPNLAWTKTATVGVKATANTNAVEKAEAKEEERESPRAKF
ncbi:MAG: hypothetical protein M3R00_03510 [Pseudomonadota bacterium]|nr:hypothetical protein [Pseudomonadota bacterium]